MRRALFPQYVDTDVPRDTLTFGIYKSSNKCGKKMTIGISVIVTFPATSRLNREQAILSGGLEIRVLPRIWKQGGQN